MSLERIRVVHIASGDRWAGAEVQVCTLLTQLKRMGEVEVAAILLNEGELARRLRAEGITVWALDESRHGFFRLLWQTMRTLRTIRPTLLHTHRQKENLLGAIAGVLLRIPSLRTAHGAPEFGSPDVFKRLLARVDDFIAVHIQTAVVAVSEGLAAQLARSLPGATIRTVTNGIDVDAVRAAAMPPADLGPRADGLLDVGIVGRLDPVKRVDLFLQMAAKLVRKEPEKWRFHVFGEGRLEPELKEQARSLGIASKVRFHGHRLDIAACLASLDVLVMCSDHEGPHMMANMQHMAQGNTSCCN